MTIDEFTLGALCFCILAFGVVSFYVYVGSLYRRATLAILATGDPHARDDLVKRANKLSALLGSGPNHIPLAIRYRGFYLRHQRLQKFLPSWRVYVK